VSQQVLQHPRSEPREMVVPFERSIKLSEKLAGIPKSTEQVLSPSTETVSAAPQHHVLVDGFSPDRADHADLHSDNDVPQNAKAGHTNHIQLVPRGNAHPVRVRKSGSKATLGGHVTSEPAPIVLDSHSSEMESAKVKLFTRGGSGTNDKKPRPNMSDRDFNSKGSDAPNRRQK
jgi:hypothetical protein